MTKDLFIIDTRCHLNKSIEKAFKAKGYEVEVGKSNTVTLHIPGVRFPVKMTKP